MKCLLGLLLLLTLSSCAHNSTAPKQEGAMRSVPSQSGYLKVNGTDIYYEIYGQGEPLVLLHGGGSDIHVSFGKGIATLAKHFRVIAFDEQGAPPQFWDMMKSATINSMPQDLKDAYVKVSPRPQDLKKMFEYDSNRMRNFKDIPDKSIRSVKIPVLIMQTDQDVATLEHGVRVTRLLSQGRFAVLPGPHDNYIGDVSKDSPGLAQASLNIMIDFLK